MDSSVPILPARHMLLSGARASNGQEPLCSIVSDSYERKNLILTTNLEFSKWGSVFTDKQMAAAVLDRLAHHANLLMVGGQSYRMEHALMRQDAVVEPAS